MLTFGVKAVRSTTSLYCKWDQILQERKGQDRVLTGLDFIVELCVVSSFSVQVL